MAAIRVNAGGEAYTDASGNIWPSDYGFSGGSAQGSTRTDNPLGALYGTSRVGNSISYTFPVAPGARTVTLKFAEAQPTGKQSWFDVAINEQEALSGFSILEAAGAPYVGVDRRFEVQSGGQVTIQLTSRSGEASISGIEIR